MDLRRVQERQQARLPGGVVGLQGPGHQGAVQQEAVRNGCVLRHQPRLPHGRALHHGGGVAGPLRQEHVHRPHRGGAEELQARFHLLQRLQGQADQLQGAGPELRDCRDLQHHLP